MLSSPPRLLPPISPARRPPSPTMSPGGRRGRGLGTTDESHLRDLSPDTTLRAFTQKPMPYDTSRDEYKIFACIETLTPAERDLGARVAKAAQRLKGWCEEIEQWGWSGSFEQPSEEYRERRRRSLELRIKEHDRDGTLADKLPPLEYWGSLLSVEVESHEARLDEIGDELIALDVEELKGHVMDMHPGSRSRPSSAGYDASRDSYKPLDDFDFLITQTLLSALPHHFQLKDRLSTWTARVTILREAPRYLADLRFAKKLMRMGWEALEPPKSASDSAFSQWKDTVGTASEAMRDRVGDLGRRLDRMLDTLEGRDDCLPDNWIDIFEGVEADYGRWTHESRKRMIDFDVRRHLEYNAAEGREATPKALDTPTVTVRAHEEPKGPLEEPHKELREESPQEPAEELLEKRFQEEHKQPLGADTEVKQAPLHHIETAEPRSVKALGPDLPQIPAETQEPASNEPSQFVEDEPESPDEESFFEEGDTVVHNEIDDSPSGSLQAGTGFDGYKESPIIITTEDQDNSTTRRPETPRSRRTSIDSIASDVSYSSSLPGAIEESPSVRNTTSRAIKAPRPALNAAMTKRRPARKSNELSIDSAAPWPPTQFAHKTPTSADDLDRKISDILETLPAHIRLTSNSRASARDLRSPRVTSKGSKGNIRAKPSLNGMKSPELTLSPAKPDFESANAVSGRKSAAALRPDADNGIKVYHLTQPGKEHPIKLFIRRVGENGERVMVRVGGGWADLGEYLRQYAEHHGRRTVSSEKFEILGLEVGNNELSPGRPESAMSKRDRRFSGGHQASSPSTTPVKAAGTGLAKNEAPPPMPNFTATPAGSGENSAPSTGSSRQSWQGNEVGLAGPKSKKLDLSNEKLEWIEGMMKQARTVSGNISQTPNQPNERGESRSESRSESRTGARKKTDFGDLGKVGGTKRIFMRGGALHEH